MTYNIVTYTTIEERNGVPFLFDPSKHNQLCVQVDNLENAYREIPELLKRYDYPVRREWIEEIAQNGADGLRTAIIEDNVNEAKRLKVPHHIAEQWKRNAIQDVPRELLEKADEIRWRIARLSDGIPPASFAFTDAGEVALDKASCKEIIKTACSYKITDQIMAEAESILTLANQIRELEYNGINARELTSKYVSSDKAPDSLELYRDIATRRHRPGCLAPTDLTPFIMAAKNAQLLNNK